MTLKIIGIVIILCAAAVLRSVMCESRKKRLVLCEELHRFFLHIRTRISCYLEVPSRLYIGFESEALAESGFLEKLSEGEDICKSLDSSEVAKILTKEQLHAAKEVLSSVGTGYLDEQVKLLDVGNKSFFSLLEKERASLSRDIKLINTLSASLSVGIAIVLI